MSGNLVTKKYEASINEAILKWMVYFMENPKITWMITRGNTPCIDCFWKMFLHFLIKTEATWLPQLPICFFPAAQWPSPSQIQHALCLLAASKRPRHHAAPCGSMMHKLSLWIEFQCDFQVVSRFFKIFSNFFKIHPDVLRLFRGNLPTFPNLRGPRAICA